MIAGTWTGGEPIHQGNIVVTYCLVSSLDINFEQKAFYSGAKFKNSFH